MTDNRTKEQRSYNMSRIRSKHTKPEIIVRKFLYSKGIRYRIHYSKLPGKPDIAIPRAKTAIFVNGCFWHGHKGCKNAKVPSTNRDFWVNKITVNLERDSRIKRQLNDKGWRVLVVWECQLQSAEVQRTFSGLLESLLKSQTFGWPSTLP
jgi:DNA mismatch endonuclease (patch repair protein)